MQRKKSYITLAILLLLFIQPLRAQVRFDIESGLVSTGFNKLRIPGSSGTFISLSDELNSKNSLYSRIRSSYRFREKHEVSALFAPLQLVYKGVIGRNVDFQNETFLSDRNLKVTYKFNSYRATYRYYIVSNARIDFAAGLTIKVRDAYIAFDGELGQSAIKRDLGLVPLVNLWFHWRPTRTFGLCVDADALAAPQGRAEDVLVAITARVSDRITIKGGYRLLEGGADNSTVYTFSLFHYASLGLLINLE